MTARELDPNADFTCWVTTDHRGLDSGTIFETSPTEAEALRGLPEWGEGARVFKCVVRDRICTSSSEVFP